MINSDFDVVGIGNAIVDVLAQTKDAFLEDNALSKGTMTIIDAETAESLYAKMGPAIEVSGGSAANTIASLSSLGGKGHLSARFATINWAMYSPATSMQLVSTSTPIHRGQNTNRPLFHLCYAGR